MSSVSVSREKPSFELANSWAINDVSAILRLSQEFPVIMFRWLYSLILAIDANFRLKLKNRGIKNDPPLGDGWGHWAPNGPYKEYINTYGWQEEVSTRTF
jgi:hypothetical protein